MTNKCFDHIILVFILLSTINFTIDDPLNDPNSTFTKVLYYIDWCLTIIFVIEVMIKCLAYGIFFNGRKSYLRLPFNFVDALIIMISVIIQLNILDILTINSISQFVNHQSTKNMQSVKTYKIDI